MLKKFFIAVEIFTCLVCFSKNSAAQSLVINELMASNTSAIKDEDGDYSDWIELFNSSSTKINLHGYGLSDDTSNVFKWVFPQVELNPYEHLLVFASDKNRSQFVKHWETIIDWGDIWKYRLGTSEPPSNWKNLGYDDQSWLSGKSGFGYGDNDDSTIVPSVQSVYLRKSFLIDDNSKISQFVLNVDYDDAFVAYLNGVEVARANIGTPGIPPLFNTSADAYVEPKMILGGKPSTFFIMNFDSLVKNGENILAIQVHNYGTGSSDLTLIPFLSIGIDSIPAAPRGASKWLSLPYQYLHTNFKLSAEGETLVLTNNNANVVDEISYYSLRSDISFGRKPDGSSTWFLFEDSTPGESNTTNTYLGTVTEPIVSVQAGFYSSPVNVEIIKEEPEDLVYYTLDGSEPTTSSAAYQSPVPITQTKVLRVKAFRQGYLPSRTVTKTYFINFSTQLPVVSVSSNPDNFFSEEYGIYTLGDSAESSFPYFGANFWKDWEIPAHIELFENSKAGFSIDAGIQIFGGWSRGNAQKSLAVFARGQYGYSSINYKLFDDLPFTEYQAFVLRNSGNDWLSTMFRDGLMTGLMDGTDLDKQAFKPAVVFINGTYWGIHNIREKVNEHFLAQHHNLNPDSLDILEYSGDVIQGNNEDYNSLYSFIESSNLSIPINYEYVKSKIDVQNFMRYHVAQIYFANTDWPGTNVKFWRNNKNGKWRWILYDTDFGFGLFNRNAHTFNALNFATEPNGPDYPNPPWSTLFLRKLLENQSFKNDFINCFADFANSIFKSSHVIDRINLHKSKIDSEINRHSQRWNQFNYDGWISNINYLQYFANYRLTYMQLHFVQKFGLAGLAPVSISISDTAMGSVLLNSLTIESPNWTGSYFLGVPIKITAKPKLGYHFARWEGVDSAFSENLSIILNQSLQLKAVFERDTSFLFPQIVINEINYNSSDAFDTEDWIEFYNNSSDTVDISGWVFKDSDDSHAYFFPPGSIINPGDYFVLCIDTALFRSLFADVPNVFGNTGFGLSGSGELIRLFDDQANIIDSLTYDDNFPWPEEADGNGSTLSLKNPNLDNTIPENWTASLGHGTPGKINDVATNLQSEESLPKQYHVWQNYPNPFNSSTIINFAIPVPSRLIITVYNILGETVETLLDEYKSPGYYSINFNAEDLPSGVYFYSVKAGNYSNYKKFLLLR